MGLFSKKEANIVNLKADHEDLYNEAVAVGVDQSKETLAKEVASIQATAVKVGQAEGADAERARIEGINDCTIIGQEALAKTLIADGKTSAGEAAIQMINANKTANVDGLKKIETTSANPVADETEETVVDKTEMTAKQRWDADPKLAKEFSSFEVFEAMDKNTDNFKVLRK
jgi:hypothetical protein